MILDECNLALLTTVILRGPVQGSYVPGANSKEKLGKINRRFLFIKNTFSC